MPFVPIALFLAAAAAPQPAPIANEVTAIAACRGIADGAARLACYDQAANKLQQALASKDLTVLSRADVRQTRRSLFGFTLPKIPFLGGADEGDAKQITAKVTSIRASGYNKWQFRLEDGALWETTEPSVDGYMPDKGSSVTIKTGVLGNYFVLFPGMHPVRGRRVS